MHGWCNIGEIIYWHNISSIHVLIGQYMYIYIVYHMLTDRGTCYIQIASLLLLCVHDYHFCVQTCIPCYDLISFYLISRLYVTLEMAYMTLLIQQGNQISKSRTQESLKSLNYVIFFLANGRRYCMCPFYWFM